MLFVGSNNRKDEFMLSRVQYQLLSVGRGFAIELVCVSSYRCDWLARLGFWMVCVLHLVGMILAILIDRSNMFRIFTFSPSMPPVTVTVVMGSSHASYVAHYVHPSGL